MISFFFNRQIRYQHPAQFDPAVALPSPKKFEKQNDKSVNIAKGRRLI